MLEPSGEAIIPERPGIFNLSPRQWGTLVGGAAVMCVELRFGHSELNKAIGFLGAVAGGSPFAEKLIQLDQEIAEEPQPSTNPPD
jgi:hypothetical protein